jgi:hypothetical protein
VRRFRLIHAQRDRGRRFGSKPSEEETTLIEVDPGFRTYPSRHGALVRQRYEAAITAAGKAEFQIAELTELRERATEGQLAHATGRTISAALGALETALSSE